MLSKTTVYSIMRERPAVVLHIANTVVKRLSPFVRQVDFALDWVSRLSPFISFSWCYLLYYDQGTTATVIDTEDCHLSCGKLLIGRVYCLYLSLSLFLFG